MSAVVYRGYGPLDSPAGGRLVTVTRDGIESPLRHIVRHSPTGMTWGYAGSGPADLARSLLIDALGDQARCQLCRGTARVAIPQDEDSDADIVAFDGDLHGWDPVEQHRRGLDVQPCWGCEQGIVALPYQHFKRDYVAAWPESGWTITQAAVLAWRAEVTACGHEHTGQRPPLRPHAVLAQGQGSQVEHRQLRPEPKQP